MPSPRRSESNSRPATAAETPTREHSEAASPSEAGGLLFQKGSGSGSPGPENPPPIPDSPNDPGTGSGSPFASTPGPSESGAGPGDGRGPGFGSEPRSTTKPRRRLGKRELRDAAQAVVTTAGGIAHSILTRADTIERAAGLWLPDAEDVDAISDPLAGLASRRTPEGVDNPDATDLVRLLVGVAGYVVKQVRRRAELRDLPDQVDFLAGGVDHDPDRNPDREQARDRDRANGGKPAAGPVAWLRNRHEGTETRTDPQPDLDLSSREDTAP